MDPRLSDGYVIDKEAIVANGDVAQLAADGIKLTVYEVCKSISDVTRNWCTKVITSVVDWLVGW